MLGGVVFFNPHSTVSPVVTSLYVGLHKPAFVTASCLLLFILSYGTVRKYCINFLVRIRAVENYTFSLLPAIPELVSVYTTSQANFWHIYCIYGVSTGKSWKHKDSRNIYYVQLGMYKIFINISLQYYILFSSLQVQ